MKQKNVTAAIGLIDDIVQHLDGLFDPNDPNDHLTIAHERATAAQALLKDEIASVDPSAAQGLLAAIKGACLCAHSKATEARFLENTGRDANSAELIRVTLESGRVFMLEGPFSEASGFLVAETPLGDQQKVAIALKRIEFIEFSE